MSVSTVGGTFAHTWTSGFFWGPTDLVGLGLSRRRRKSAAIAA